MTSLLQNNSRAAREALSWEDWLGIPVRISTGPLWDLLALRDSG